MTEYEKYNMRLLKITDYSGKITYQAVDENMEQNVLDTSSAYTYLNDQTLQFNAEMLGDIEVYIDKEWLND